MSAGNLRFVLALTVIAGFVPGSSEAQAPNALTEQERAAGWRLLFDGRSTAGWRAYKQQAMSLGWSTVEGALTRTGRGGDIITTEQFGNFEFALEWKVGPRGNSGIFYRGVEGQGPIYYSAPEMQVLDDEAHADGKSPLTSAGSNYGLYPAPRGVVKPVGEWNAARILVDGNRVEHWLNGVKVVEYELGSAEWTDKVKNSKFNQWPEYGKAVKGYIGLQDHGDWVAFRSIKVRVIP